MKFDMRKSVLAWLLTMVALGVSAQSWIDLTDSYLVNPTFDNNSSDGWTVIKNSGGRGFDVEMCEFWYGTFYMFQDVSLPRGKYRLSVQGYYRPTNNSDGIASYKNGTEELTAMLFADDAEVPMVSIYSEVSDSYFDGCWEYRPGGNQGGWGGGWGNQGQTEPSEYYPNTMEAADKLFKKGKYWNELEFETEGGEVSIGIYNDVSRADNWCIFDNFKLEFYGTVVTVTSITLSANTLELMLGETEQLTATIAPANATYRKLEWSSSDEAVVKVDQDGNVQAVGAGSANVVANATDGSNRRATCRVTVKEKDLTAESVVINEIMAANVDMFIDPSWNYGAFVELYNPSTSDVSLANCYISNGVSTYRLSVDAGILPAKGYHVLWFENHSRYAPKQVDVELDLDGGTITFARPDGTVIASATYPTAIGRTSYARKSDGSDDWGYTADPTPGSSNNGSQFPNNRLSTPEVDKPAQVFNGSLQVSVNIPSGATLRYTTNGSTPTLTNGETSATGLFNISETTTIRFRLFQDGKLPSNVVTRSYIAQDRDYELPIISIVTDNDNIYGNDYGIFVQGNGNGIAGNGKSQPCNWNTDWERPVSFEYMKDGKAVFSQEVYMKSAGGWSRAWEPHSFKLKANKIFDGNKYMEYPFFDEKPYLRHKVLQIRNGGNDNNARFKDPALQQIVARSGIDIDYQSYQPTVHFINGRYIGVINMREPNNKHFGLANKGIDTDEMDQFEISPDSNYVQKAGDKAAFDRWYDLSFQAANESAYEEIRNLVDVDEFANYMAVQFYLGGSDWPRNNVKAYRPRIDGGKFRFVLFDVDHAFSYGSNTFSEFQNKLMWTFDALYDTTDAIAAGHNLQGNKIVEEVQVARIFYNMLENDTFRKQFIDTFCLVTGSVFEPTRCQEIVEELRERVINSMEGWEQNALYSTSNNITSNLTSSRQNSMTNALKNYNFNGTPIFQLSDTERQQVKLSADISEAQLFVNNLCVPTNKFDGYLYAPIRLKAAAPANYQFLGWTDDNSTTTGTTILGSGASWYYYDQGSLDNTNWMETVDDSWEKGNAPLGYFTSDAANGRGYQTFLDWGSDTNNKRPTYYFTKKITLANQPGSNDKFQLNYTIDDGFIVYVNGQEAGRYNMPSGTITYSSYATQYAHNNPDTGNMNLPTSLFQQGTNVIAVEIHNCDNHSTDMYWDANIVMTSASGGTNFISTEEELEMPSSGTHSYVAHYRLMNDEELKNTDAHPVKINEVSASNSVYVNEFFKKNDWIELYNTTDATIDVAGMYLSDNLSKPQKFQIPAASAVDATYSTRIPAHGYLVVWCDKLNPYSQLHTTFKLAAEGGDVLLTAADESWCDTLTYIPHNGDQSVGLYPNGGSNVYVMNTPTIGRSNLLTSYAVQYDEPKKLPEPSEPDAIASYQLANNGGMSINYNGNDIIIRSDDPTQASANVFTTAGQKVLAVNVDVPSTARVSTESLPAGIYIVRVRNSEGDTCQIKFIKR